jgi:hypothetical protein
MISNTIEVSVIRSYYCCKALQISRFQNEEQARYAYPVEHLKDSWCIYNVCLAQVLWVVVLQHLDGGRGGG